MTLNTGRITDLVWYWTPPLVYAGLIFFLSSLSHPEDTLPSLVTEVGDKTLHTVEFGLLAILLYRAFRYAAGQRVATRALVWAVVGAALYGVTDEIHQSFVPLREASWLDWAADTIGAMIGAIGFSRVTGDSEEKKRSISPDVQKGILQGRSE